MTTKRMMIIRDIVYTILIIAFLLPGDLNPFAGINFGFKILIAFLMLSTRIFQHVNYYKATGKIY
ncbi:hypothetical protein [Mucilaginibacter sp. dw_454]|uniref:hypothetical protein n=1 Tax=Mucilaginibacter sp. dw_454 TaxID=2720079 RepID=UPI001BD20A9C|nr:hypothetical protein [Mucilaginibacter sp. dw_454]